jgi:hypothetical protein
LWVGAPPPPAPAPGAPPRTILPPDVHDEPTVALYCKIPRSVSVALRDYAHELNRTRRKRVHLEQIVAEALRRFLEQERGAG